MMENIRPRRQSALRSRPATNLLFALLALVLLASCSAPDFPALAQQFPPIEDLNREFHFTIHDLPEPIETSLISGTVRPVGKITISDNAVLLLVSDYVPSDEPSGELAGHLFVNGKKKTTIPVASEYTYSYRYSTLTSDLVLTSD